MSVVNASLSSKQMHMTGYDDKGAAVGGEDHHGGTPVRGEL